MNFPTAHALESTETPRLTIQAAFALYQDSLEKILRDELDHQLSDGNLLELAMAEVAEANTRVHRLASAARIVETEIASVLAPVVQATFRAVMAKPKKQRRKP